MILCIQGISGDCTLGEGVQLGDRVSVKHSAIGNHCHIGDRSKVTNTVMMDHVVVGEGLVLGILVVRWGILYIYMCTTQSEPSELCGL